MELKIMCGTIAELRIIIDNHLFILRDRIDFYIEYKVFKKAAKLHGITKQINEYKAMLSDGEIGFHARSEIIWLIKEAKII